MTSRLTPEREWWTAEEIAAAALPDLIMADSPWHYEMRSEKGEGKSPQAHYQTMSIDEIKAMPVEMLAGSDCLLWLWTVGPMLPEALEVIDAWGFAYKTQGEWAKMTKKGKQHFGTGYILRNAGEPFLIATRGAPKTTKSVRSVIIAPVREHSRKPDEAFAEAEKLMPQARRLELFSRQVRPNWHAWGDEIDKFKGAAWRKPPPPAQLEPDVRVLDVEDALLFFTTFGGAELYLAADPKGRSELARVLGVEKARALAEEDARRGLPRRVPLGKPWVAAVLFARGLSKLESARRMHTTDVTVRKWVKASLQHPQPDPRQPRLF